MNSLSKLLLCLLGLLLPLCLSAQTPQIPQQRAYVANLPAGGRWYAVTNLDLNALDARIASIAGTSAGGSGNSPAPSNDFDYVSYNGAWRKLSESPIVSFDSILEANGSATSRTFYVQSGNFSDSLTVGSTSLSQSGTNALTITAPYGITGIPDPRGGSSPVPYSILLSTNALMALSVLDAKAAASAQSQFLSNEVVRVETAAALAADLTYPIATNAYANSLLGVAAYPIATNALTQATKALSFAGAVSNQLVTHKANGAADHPTLATKVYVDNALAAIVPPDNAAAAYVMATNALTVATNATLVAADAKAISTNAILIANDAKAIAQAATNRINLADMPTAVWKGTNGISIGAGSRATAAGTFALGYFAYADDARTFVFNGNGNTNGYASHGIGTFNVNPTNGANGFYIGSDSLASVVDTAIAPYKRPSTLYNVFYDIPYASAMAKPWELTVTESPGGGTIGFPVAVSNFTDAAGAPVDVHAAGFPEDTDGSLRYNVGYVSPWSGPSSTNVVLQVYGAYLPAGTDYAVSVDSVDTADFGPVVMAFTNEPGKTAFSFRAEVTCASSAVRTFDLSLIAPSHQAATNALDLAQQALAASGGLGTNDVNSLSAVIVSNHNLSASAHTDIRADVSNAVDLASGAVKTNSIGSIAIDEYSTATGIFSLAYGYESTASGDYSVCFGFTSESSGYASFASGESAIASGDYSHAEGSRTEASGENAHSEGSFALAGGRAAHAEGESTEAIGISSHASGYNTKAIGDYSYSGGRMSIASNYNSFVWNHPITLFDYYISHGIGTFNINTRDGASGFFIGETNLQTLLDARLSVSDFASSNAVTQASINGKLSTNAYDLASFPTNLVAGSNVLITGTKQNPTISALDTPGLIDVSNRVVSIAGTLGPLAGTQAVHTAAIAGLFQTNSALNESVGHLAGTQGVHSASIAALYQTNDNTSQVISGLFQSNAVVHVTLAGLAQTQQQHTVQIAGVSNLAQAAYDKPADTNAVNDLAGVLVSNHDASPVSHSDIRASVSNVFDMALGAVKTNSVGGLAIGPGSIANGEFSISYGQDTTTSGGTSQAFGYRTTSSGVNSFSGGYFSEASGYASFVFGDHCSTMGEMSFAIGNHSIAFHEYSFVWSGGNGISSHGFGTFNIDPVNGASGFYIGETNLQTLLDARLPATYNSQLHTYDVPLGNGVVGQLFQETHVYAMNRSGSTIANGKVVCVSGAQGDNVLIEPASASNPVCTWNVIGLVTEDAGIANKTSGYVTTFGNVNDLNTSMFAISNTLWLAENGNLTNVEPAIVVGKSKIKIGTVIRSHANEGRIFVSPQVVPNASDVGAATHSETTNAVFYKQIANSSSAVTSTVSVVPSVSVYSLTATNSTTITFDTSALNTTNQVATWELWVLNTSTNNSIVWPSTNSVYYIANPSSISANSQTIYTVWRKFGDIVQCNPYLVE